ncbi:DUF1311 protein [Erwinia sp. Ejp617]|nr:lysozyme inhibitor LprI family protein [Erwinia sp. Ejp617]ADP10151.1 DUF1311 protein [Erwinia sp. Ejp617]
MKKFLLLCAASIALAASLAVQAADICAEQLSDGSLWQCTERQKKLAEEDLNQAYIAAKKRIVQMYRSDKPLGEQYVATFTDSQRHWLKYRDGQCSLEAFAAEEGSTVHATAVNICIARIDKARSEMIKQMPY